MVTVTSYQIRQRKGGSESFVVITLTGGVELVQSATTGQFRAVVRKCQIPASFDEATAKLVIGTQMPGSIVRVQAEPYNYTDERTGEVLTFSHRWNYQPPGAAVPVPDIVEMTELV